jgi:cell division control protein 7
MATVRRRDDESFRIHEDVPRTEDTEMMVESEHRTEDGAAEDTVDDNATIGKNEDIEENGEAEDDDAQSDTSEESSGDVNKAVQEEMDLLSDCFPEFRGNYRLIKRIGEGMSSPAYTQIHKPLTAYVQAHSRPSTRPRISSTTDTRTSGILTKRTTRLPNGHRLH